MRAFKIQFTNKQYFFYIILLIFVHTLFPLLSLRLRNSCDLNSTAFRNLIGVFFFFAFAVFLWLGVVYNLWPTSLWLPCGRCCCCCCLYIFGIWFNSLIHLVLFVCLASCLRFPYVYLSLCLSACLSVSGLLGKIYIWQL